MKKLAKAFLIATALTLLFGNTAYAAIATPATYIISQANAYQHNREANDQMFLITLNVDYGTNPDENINEAWLVRILSSDNTEVGRVAPYAYFNDGYDTGAIAIYFSAADALIWEGSYTIELTGNPSLAWAAGDPPKTSTTAITWSSYTSIGTTSSELTARVRFLASSFEEDWATDLIELTSSGNQFTINGEDYFGNAIPYLRQICPNLYSDVIVVADYEERDYTQAQATTAESRWSAEALLGFTDLAATLGVTRMWVMGIMYMGFAMLLCVPVVKKTNSFKAATYPIGHVLVIGAVVGFMPFIIAPIVGVLGLLAIVLGIAWGGAS